jgi:hypothetical protein
MDALGLILPPYLYRVFDGQSVSQWDEDNGFIAGLPDTPFDRSKPWARRVVEQHMDWSNRSLTPFISTTSSLPTAVRYAQQREEMGHGGVFIARIDAYGLAQYVDVYHMQSLVRLVRAYVPHEGWNKYEYLIHGQIPAETIEEIFTLDEGE